MRVIFIAEDDSAVECLTTILDKDIPGIHVFGVCVGEPQYCTAFARHCLMSGFEFATLKDAATVALLIERFQPDILVRVPEIAASWSLPHAGFQSYALRFGFAMAGAPWPEFAPIWLSRSSSRVSLVGPSGNEVGAATVTISAMETAISLRTKHAVAGAMLVGLLVNGEEESLAATRAQGSMITEVAGSAPESILLDWDELTVERYIRAHFMPPRQLAKVVDTNGATFLIETIEQYRHFSANVVIRNGNGEQCPETHWHSNVNGSVVRASDINIHKPVCVTDTSKVTTSKKLRMNEPLISSNAERYCSSALDSTWIGVEGPHVKRFEMLLARICDCTAACVVQSGTAALYGAMKALEVSKPSDRVLVPTFTCSACADAVVHAGGTPIPIDSEMDSYGISLEATREALDAIDGVVGVIIAPCYGVPCRDFLSILTLCTERGVWLCEDAAESYGARQVTNTGSGETAQVGKLAKICVISVRSEKMVGTGEGGAILSNDPTLVASAKWWCSRAPCRGAGLWSIYNHDAVGQNFRMPEVLAAVGCASVEMLPLMIERKRAIHDCYEACFATHVSLRDVELQKGLPGNEPVWWLNAALLPSGMSAEEIGLQLMQGYPDIEIRPGFYPLHLMKIFQSDFSRPCPNAEDLYSRLICLPSANVLTASGVERVCGALAAAVVSISRVNSSCPAQNAQNA